MQSLHELSNSDQNVEVIKKVCVFMMHIRANSKSLQPRVQGDVSFKPSPADEKEPASKPK